MFCAHLVRVKVLLQIVNNVEFTLGLRRQTIQRKQNSRMHHLLHTNCVVYSNLHCVCFFLKYKLKYWAICFVTSCVCVLCAESSIKCHLNYAYISALHLYSHKFTFKIKCNRYWKHLKKHFLFISRLNAAKLPLILPIGIHQIFT